MKQVLLFAATMLLSICARAADGDTFKANTIEGVEMTFKILSESEKTVILRSGSNISSVPTSTEGSVTIPGQISYNGNSYSVTSIGDYAFDCCSKLTSITIPSTVTSIGSYAFNNMYLETSKQL